MSTTLTFASSGNGTKTGTAIANFFDDLDTLISSFSGNAAFFWQKAGKNSAATPYWLLLSPKDGSNRRIAIIAWASAPAGVNSAILDQTPSTTGIYILYFPNGSANTLSNLTASSGTVCGNDTGVVKAHFCGSLTQLYTTSLQHYYFDSAEAMYFFAGNPASAANPFYGAGSTVVDASDVAYDACVSTGGSNASFGSSSTSPMGWTSSTNNAGGTSGGVRTNYGAANRTYYCAWLPTVTWATQAVGPLDILTDTSNTKAWFVPIQLLGQTKGEGFVLKLRQFALGPATVGAFTVYNTTGPVVAARSVSNTTAGQSTGYPWITNFKV